MTACTPAAVANCLILRIYPLRPAPPTDLYTMAHRLLQSPLNLCSLEFCTPWGLTRLKPLPPSSPRTAPATMTPAQTVARSYQRIRDHNDPAVFISLRDEKDALAEAEALASKGAAALPLYGVPVAVKDNIDAQGLPTTAACPAFAYSPAQDSTAVATTARGRRHRHRQDQSRPVRDRPGRRPLALRHPGQSGPRRSHSGRIELGIGGRGLRRPGAAGARHRHRRLGPRAGDAQ